MLNWMFDVATRERQFPLSVKYAVAAVVEKERLHTRTYLINTLTGCYADKALTLLGYRL